MSASIAASPEAIAAEGIKPEEYEEIVRRWVAILTLPNWECLA